MPVQDGDTVLGINLVTGLTEAVIIPPTDPNIRPIPITDDLGLLTLSNIQLTTGGTLNGIATELYNDEGEFLSLILSEYAPYIVVMDNGMSMGNYEYVPTDSFDPSLDYQILNSSGDAQVDIALEPDSTQGGGPGGSGGGGGGSGQGQGDGDGDGGEDDIKPFPAPPDTDLLPHTCSDEEPPEPGPPGPPGPPPEPGPEEEPCAACAAGQKKGEKPTQTDSGTLSGSGQNQMDDGEGEPSGEGQGEPSGEGQGQGEGESSGEGQGESQSQGEPSGSGEGQGESSGEGSGEGSGESSGQGQGEPSGGGEGGEPSGEGQGEPSDSGQPTPDNQSGEASGGSESAPPQDSLLQQLLDEQDAREGESGQPSESAPPSDADDFMNDDTPSPESDPSENDTPVDNYDDIFDDTPPSPNGEPSMSPDDFMDEPSQDPSTGDNMQPSDSGEPRPFENLSDDELQQLIDELRETPEPTNPEEFMDDDDDDDISDVPPQPSMPGDGPMQPSDEPSDEPDEEPGTGPQGRGEEPSNQTGAGDTPNNDNAFPEPNNSTSSNEVGQSWLWINVGTGEINSGVSAPATGIWRHALYFIPNEFNNASNYIMTFDEIRRLFGESATYYQPLPTMISIEFSGPEEWVAAQAYLPSMEDQYWDIEIDVMALSCTISFNYLEQLPSTEPRWVPMSTDQDGDIVDENFNESQSAAQDMIDQINEENQLANDRGIPTGYGEGSTSPFIPDAESNSALQQEAADAGADAGKGDAQMAKEGASKETNDARQQAQQNARDIEQSNDLDSALEIVESAVENAQRANASADPNTPEDVNNRNQAMTAANEALDSISELLQPQNDTADYDIQAQLDAIRESLNELEVGESSSLAESFAEEAKKARDNALEAENSEVKAAEAMSAAESAVESRNTAIEGDNKDREAVQEASNMAQQAVDMAVETGEDMQSAQELIDSIPPFNELPDLATDAEARMRDTMPGEFADINNPDVEEDMMAVAEQAVSNLEQAVSEANPANQYDRDTTDYIADKTTATITNVEGSWGGDPEDIEELRERVNEALREFSAKVESICALWNPNTMSWYRGTTGDILVFSTDNDALVYGLQRGLIPVNAAPMSMALSENWEDMEIKPIGVGGVI